MLRYFIQPQLNVISNSIIGYELLLRELKGQRWQLPQNISAIPISEQIELFIASVACLPKNQAAVALNLNRNEFLNAELTNAILTAQQVLQRPLTIELTEEPLPTPIATETIQQQAKRFSQHDIRLSLDDVGTGDNTWIQLEPLIPLASEIKFAMQNLRNLQRTTEIPALVRFWQTIAKQHHLQFVLEGVETAADDQLAEQFAVNFRQGYYYGQPHLLRLNSQLESER